MAYLTKEKREEIKEFVREHYGKMRQKDMMRALGVSEMTIIRAARELKLINTNKRLNYMGSEKPEYHFNGIFNVNARWSWLAG